MNRKKACCFRCENSPTNRVGQSRCGSIYVMACANASTSTIKYTTEEEEDLNVESREARATLLNSKKTPEDALYRSITTQTPYQAR